MRTLLPSLDCTVSGIALYHRAIRGCIVYDNQVLQRYIIETQKMCHCSSSLITPTAKVRTRIAVQQFYSLVPWLLFLNWVIFRLTIQYNRDLNAFKSILITIFTIKWKKLIFLSFLSTQLVAICMAGGNNFQFYVCTCVYACETRCATTVSGSGMACQQNCPVELHVELITLSPNAISTDSLHFKHYMKQNFIYLSIYFVTSYHLFLFRCYLVFTLTIFRILCLST